MFTAAERFRLRDGLLKQARDDPRIVAAALVGSAARGQEDRWSDIDLALRLAPGQQDDPVVQFWTTTMYATHGAIAHTDVRAGATLYRVYLLGNSLQVDVSWWAYENFAPRGGPMRLVFGEANEQAVALPRSQETLIGMGWLYALHARSSIARGRGMQALHMLNGMREHVISLLCLGAGLDPDQGRGVDDLPEGTKTRLLEALAHDVDKREQLRAFAVLTELLADHIDATVDSASTLRTVLHELVRDAASEQPWS